MINKIIKDQLLKVKKADLNNFNEETNIYFIPKKNELKLEVNKTYIIYIKPSFYANETFNKNWNNNTKPNFYYAMAEINIILSDRIKVTCIEMDIQTHVTKYNFWSGWISLEDVQVLQEWNNV